MGFSTSRIMGHRSMRGARAPGAFADVPELLGLAGAMKRAGSGVFQIIPASTLPETANAPDRWREVIALVKDGDRAGSQVFPQIGNRQWRRGREA